MFDGAYDFLEIEKKKFCEMLHAVGMLYLHRKIFRSWHLCVTFYRSSLLG